MKNTEKNRNRDRVDKPKRQDSDLIVDGIIRHLRNVTYARRPHEIFDDWLDMVEAELQMLPRHADALITTGAPATLSQEMVQVEDRIRRNYPDEASRKHFEEATLLLYDAAVPFDGCEEYRDILGLVFNELELSNDRTGQFFTPWTVSLLMARMTFATGGMEVREAIDAAVAQHPRGSALQEIGMRAINGEHTARYLARDVLPECFEHYKPFRIMDTCVGSGGLLLAAASCFPRWMVSMGLVEFWGMDIDARCAKMGRINIMLHGMNGWGLKWEIAGQGLLMKLAGRESPASSIPARGPDTILQNVDAGHIDLTEYEERSDGQMRLFVASASTRKQ